MKITATTHALTVSYKAPGVVYTGGSEEGADTHPFDTVTVNVGESFDVSAGSKIIRVAELGLGVESSFDGTSGD